MDDAAHHGRGGQRARAGQRREPAGPLCALAVGYVCGLGYLKWLSPPEKVLRFLESRLNLLQRLPRYVSVDAKTYGRFGVLPGAGGAGGPVPGIPLGVVGSTQRLGP